MKALKSYKSIPHLIDMMTLRAVAEDVTFPLSDQEISLVKMMYLAPFKTLLWLKTGLRGGVARSPPS